MLQTPVNHSMSVQHKPIKHRNNSISASRTVTSPSMTTQKRSQSKLSNLSSKKGFKCNYSQGSINIRRKSNCLLKKRQ
jgi:hypothetical protein